MKPRQPKLPKLNRDVVLEAARKAVSRPRKRRAKAVRGVVEDLITYTQKLEWALEVSEAHNDDHKTWRGFLAYQWKRLASRFRRAPKAKPIEAQEPGS